MVDRNDARLQALSSLLQVEQEARKAESHSELSFVIVNDTRRVLLCDQAWFWLFDEFGAPRIERVSNVSDIDGNSLQVRWMNRLLAWCLQQSWHTEARVLTADDVEPSLAVDWSEYLAPQVLYVPFASKGFPGGLLLASKTPWLDGHKALAEILAGTYAHAWSALSGPAHKQLIVAHFRRHWRRYLVAVVVLVLYPARQYVLAPAEVVPSTPIVVTAPLTGVIDTIDVMPNATVDKDVLLFTLEDTELENRLIISQRALEVAQAEYLKNAQASFDCEECRASAAELKAIVDREQAQVALARAQFERSKVRSPAAGVVIYSDPVDWDGRPVRVGEKVMTVADPGETSLRIELAVDDAIAIEEGADVVFYPNISPLLSYDANITRTSYEAVVTAEQTLAYPLQASFGEEQARLGMRGTAKVYGGRAPIIYLALRKPLAWLRRALGV